MFGDTKLMRNGGKSPPNGIAQSVERPGTVRKVIGAKPITVPNSIIQYDTTIYKKSNNPSNSEESSQTHTNLWRLRKRNLFYHQCTHK